MPHPSSLSIFLPAFNEELNVGEAVQAAVDAARGLCDLFEVIVVDDGSTDRTAAIVHDLANQDHRIRLVSHETNRGYGAALRSGIGASTHDWVFFTDADNQFDVRQLADLFHFVPEYDVVIGYRAKRQDPLRRFVTSRLWSFLTRATFGLTVRDTNCAFKLFRGELIRSLPLESEGAMINAEILLRLSSAGVPIKEAPVTHYARVRGVAGGARPKVQLQAFRELLRLYRKGLGKN